ncbi:hypothetical protein MKK84_19580 [Methylobacterium sp. E-065]|uniref:hypothetical protein n=1 Tax=Methylobacterium sp. E-065 TaxID=2836583 RepID=UPI001FBB582B|nr:hypothetical protein [Methylobacterium sp. E-065]MCJ2019608.1 hypothetical protein [Methylobacterium sp. E-065]
MSTFTQSEDPLIVTRGRPVSWPMQWQDPAGKPIDVTGFSFAATLRWQGSEAAMTAPLVDAAAGRFKVACTGDQVAGIPAGRLSTLSLSITDTAGEVHDYKISVIGVIP